MTLLPGAGDDLAAGGGLGVDPMLLGRHFVRNRGVAMSTHNELGNWVDDLGVQPTRTASRLSGLRGVQLAFKLVRGLSGGIAPIRHD